MTTTYRDDLGAAFLRLDALLERRRGEVDLVSSDIASVHSARTGRILFGLVLTFCAVTMGTLGAAALLAPGSSRDRFDGTATWVLVAAWPLAGFAYLVARFLTGRGLQKQVARALERTDDPHADIARLERTDAARLAAEAVDRGEVAGIAIPLIGLSLAFPLTVHLLVGMLFSQGALKAAAFDAWIAYSVVCAGPAHIVLAGLCWRFAVRMHRMPSETVRHDWLMPAVGALGFSALAAVVPTIIIAPVIDLLTGAVPIPLMFHFAARRVAAERQALRAALG